MGRIKGKGKSRSKQLMSNDCSEDEDEYEPSAKKKSLVFSDSEGENESAGTSRSKVRTSSKKIVAEEEFGDKDDDWLLNVKEEKLPQVREMADLMSQESCSQSTPRSQLWNGNNVKNFKTFRKAGYANQGDESVMDMMSQSSSQSSTQSQSQSQTISLVKLHIYDNPVKKNIKKLREEFKVEDEEKTESDSEDLIHIQRRDKRKSSSKNGSAKKSRR